MWAIIALALLPLAADQDPCGQARSLYQALSLEAALAAAEAELGQGPERPLACVEVSALALMVSGRLEEARARLSELFERDPERRLEDPSLPPALRNTIEQIREEVRPLSSEVRARWLIHDSLRLDIVLSGGLRDAALVRYQTQIGPEGRSVSGELPLVGRVATGTIAVDGPAEARTLQVVGQIVGRSGRVLHQLSSQLLLPERPLAKDAVVVESGVPWWVWALVGAVTVGAAVSVAIIAQPSLPDASGTFGRGTLEL